MREKLETKKLKIVLKDQKNKFDYHAKLIEVTT